MPFCSLYIGKKFLYVQPRNYVSTKTYQYAPTENDCKSYTKTFDKKKEKKKRRRNGVVLKKLSDVTFLKQIKGRAQSTSEKQEDLMICARQY